MTDGWDPNLLGPDPVPGDASWTMSQATQLGFIAHDAGQALSSLRGIHQQLAGAAWKGEAAERFAGTVNEVVISDMGKLHSSYDRAGSALRTFGDRVVSLQAEAAQLMAQAREAVAERDTAQQGVDVQSGARANAVKGAGVAEAELAVVFGEAEWRIMSSGASPGAIWAANEHLRIVAQNGQGSVDGAVVSINSQLQSGGAAPSGLAALDDLVRGVGGRAQQRIHCEGAAADASHRLAGYEATRSAAAGRLRDLRVRAEALHDNEFLPAAKMARDALFDAAKQGLHNPSFFERSLHDAGQWAWDVGHWVVDAQQWNLDIINFGLRAANDVNQLARGNMGALNDLSQMTVDLGHGALDFSSHLMRIVKDLQPIVAALAFIPILTPICLPLAAGMGLAIMADDAIPVVNDFYNIGMGRPVSTSKLGGDCLTLGFDGLTTMLPDANAGRSALSSLIHGDGKQLATATLSSATVWSGYAYQSAYNEVPKLYRANQQLVDSSLRSALTPTPELVDVFAQPDDLLE